MQPHVMAKLRFLLLVALLLAVLAPAYAGTYTLSDGQTITGEPVSMDASGVVLRLPSGQFAPRTPWSSFTQESLKQLQAEARRPQDAEFIAPFLEETQLEEAQHQQIVIKPVERVERPTGRTGLSALFASSLGVFLFLVLYGANLYAAYEVAFFKHQPIAMVMGVSAILPFIGPIIFMFVPARAPAVVPAADGEEALVAETHTAPQAEPVHHHHQHGSAEPAHHGEPQPTMEFSLPAEPVSSPAPANPSVTFRKGEFIFNRRFFETKMPGFFRAVPGDAEKDMVLVVRAIRGEYVARRIPKVTQTEIHLETFKEHATAEEVVPFAEIQEVSIKHKDSV
ncbi:MAG: hypothetical protein ACK4UN_03245 [Limisphaerales bacterium]